MSYFKEFHRYKVFEECLQKLGYSKLLNAKYAQAGDILFFRNYIDKLKYNKLTEQDVKINFIPNSKLFIKKDTLSRTLNGKDYILETFIGESPINLTGLWIEKPSNSSEGKGISIIRDPGLWKKSDHIIQKYLDEPYLINNKKWDIRILVMIKGDGSFHFNSNGIMRFCHENYSLSEEFDLTNKKYIYSHLTNMSLQCHKYRKLPLNKRLASFEHYESTRSKITDIIKDVVKMVMEKTRNTNENNFVYWGFDFIVDKNLKVYLLEINGFPGMFKGNKETLVYYSEKCQMDYIKFLTNS